MRFLFQDNAQDTNALGVSRNASVVLEDIVIQDCSFPEDDAVDGIIDVACDASSDEVFFFEMSNVDFVNNSNPGGSVGFSIRNQACVSVSMDGVVFSGNTFFHGLLFGQKNELKNIALFENVHVWPTSENGGQDLADQTIAKNPEKRVVYVTAEPMEPKPSPELQIEVIGSRDPVV